MPSRTATSMQSTAGFWLSLSAALASRGVTLHVPDHVSIQTIDAVVDTLQLDVQEADGLPGWFNLELGVDVDGQRVSLLPILARALDLPTLALPAAATELPDAVVHLRLDDQRHLRIPLADIRRYLAPLTEWLEQLDQRGLQLPIARSDVLADMLDQSLALRAPKTLTRLSRALRGDWKPLNPPDPEGLQAALRDYQWAGVRWLDFLAEYGLGGILADDMGLGKTMQVLAHLLAERRKQAARGDALRPSLVVMPTSLVPNWQSEAARFAPSLRVLTLHGGDRHQQFDAIAQHDLVLTTYALLHRDIDLLKRHHFGLAVFDEAQALRNASTLGARAARELMADRRLAMTGTPIENHLGELWAQTDLVLPGLFGTARDFATRYRNPIEKQQDQARKEQLHARLRPFVLRRNKSEVAKELPAKTLITRRIAIEGKQRDLYESLRLAMHKKVRQAIGKRGLNASSIIILDALLKLRQVCCDPALVKLPEAKKVGISAKREYFQEMLQELLEEGRRILVFSQFTEMLDLLEADLQHAAIAYTRLDGSTKDRAVPVQSFQSGSVPVMLISLKAGGTGLNLTAADTVIHYDPWWNPAVMRQAEDRAHRIGQDKPVFVYSLVCEDTVEDRILELQSRKAELAKAILEGGSVDAMSLDEATLNALFAPPR
ncbi:ATP-dependent helicase [Ahniella affigens]|uniref:ATP-dependent helicase n=2 Tax=Ahniella affigens TaxID=2021234 RepID=A0A2P1PYQ8_9GAMM|nr:ATP-dependent helicase [Ahniella affigens]